MTVMGSQAVQARKRAVQAQGSRVVRFRGLAFVREIPEADDLAVGLDLRRPQAAALAPYAFELRDKSTSPAPTILPIFGVRAQAQIHPTIVERIAVDVIDLDAPIRHAEYLTVHVDPMALSAVPVLAARVDAGRPTPMGYPAIRGDTRVVFVINGRDKPVAEDNLDHTREHSTRLRHRRRR